MARRILATLLAVTMITACGGGGGTSNDDDAGSTDGAGPSTTESTGSDGEETLAEFFGYGGDDPESAQAQYLDEEARRQELIRVCMAEEGFDYTPIMPPEDSYQVFGPEDEEEMVRTQGFGITTWFGNEEQFGGPEVEFEDPNQEMVDSMSDSERQAYYDALYGSEEEQMEGATTETDPETGEEYTLVEGFGAGCEGEASEEIYGDQTGTQGLWQELEPQMTAMYERVQADPRIADLNGEWSGCMAEAGYEYESREEMFQSVFDDFQQRFDDIVGPNGGYSDPFEGWTEEEVNAFFEEHTDDEINAFFQEAEQASRSDIDHKALEALQQEEIDLAVANFECGQGFDEAYQEIAAEYEADFIAANRDLLEQIRDAQGG